MNACRRFQGHRSLCTIAGDSMIVPCVGMVLAAGIFGSRVKDS